MRAAATEPPMVMANEVEVLTRFCEQWKGNVASGETALRRLLDLQKQGIGIVDSNGKDVLQTLVQEAFQATQTYRRALKIMESARDRAIANHDDKA
jgi:hypothetical protein